MSLTPEQDTSIANAVEAAQRIARLFTSDTAGPFPAADPPPAIVRPSSPKWVDGWYAKARRVDVHPGRIGGVIAPWSIVQHSTDMPPEDWDALIASLKRSAGAGNAFTFGVGINAEQGLIQIAPVTRNANHAGGPTSGRFVVDGKLVHPNTCTVGIEAHNAGILRWVGGVWRFVEDGKAHGAAFAEENVIRDPARAGVSYHKASTWQLDTLRELWTDLEEVLHPLPHGAITRAYGEAVQPWGDTENARIVTHHMLDPQARSDPWRQISAAAKTYAAGRGW